MAVKIRLARRGRKKLAKFDIVVADARSPRDGKFIEKLGTYDPLTVPATINIEESKAFDWLMKGAQPSDTVKAIFSYRGIMLKRHLQVGVVKGAISQETADEKLAEWKKEKEAKISARKESILSAKQKMAVARKATESKLKEARAELIKKKAELALAKETAKTETTEANAEVDKVDDSTIQATTPNVESTEPTSTPPKVEKAEVVNEKKDKEVQEPKAESVVKGHDTVVEEHKTESVAKKEDKVAKKPKTESVAKEDDNSINDSKSKAEEAKESSANKDSEPKSAKEEIDSK